MKSEKSQKTPTLSKWTEGGHPKGRPWNVFTPDGTYVRVEGHAVPHGENEFFATKAEALAAHPDAEEEALVY
jgi:hypothetical protein